MRLDRRLADSEIVGNLLVQLPVKNGKQNFELGWREPRNSFAHSVFRARGLPDGLAPAAQRGLDRCLDHVQRAVLSQETDRAKCPGLFGCCGSFSAGHDQNGDLRTFRMKQRDSRIADGTWHLEVEQYQSQPFNLGGDPRRCQVCGRSRAVYRKFKLCRVCFRELASDGMIPGVKKASR